MLPKNCTVHVTEREREREKERESIQNGHVNFWWYGSTHVCLCASIVLYVSRCVYMDGWMDGCRQCASTIFHAMCTPT